MRTIASGTSQGTDRPHGEAEADRPRLVSAIQEKSYHLMNLSRRWHDVGLGARAGGGRNG